MKSKYNSKLKTLRFAEEVLLLQLNHNKERMKKYGVGVKLIIIIKYQNISREFVCWLTGGVFATPCLQIYTNTVLRRAVHASMAGALSRPTKWVVSWSLSSCFSVIFIGCNLILQQILIMETTNNGNVCVYWTARIRKVLVLRRVQWKQVSRCFKESNNVMFSWNISYINKLGSQ